MTPLSDLTSGELTAAGKAALHALAARPMHRVKNGWHAPGKRVTLGVAEQLTARGLARKDFSAGRAQLVITGAGTVFAGVLQQRRIGA